MLFVCSMFVVGCGSSSDNENAGEPNASVDDILAAASTRMAETQSLRFSLDVEGETFIDPAGSIQLVAARGELARPDKVAVDFQVRLFGTGTVTIKMITVGESSWTTDLLTGDWTIAPPEFGYNPSVLYDNQQGLGPVMGRLQNPALQGREDVGGRDVFRVSGTASEATMGPLTSNTMTGEPVGLQLWIDSQTWDLLRVVVTEPESSGKDDPATWTMNLSNHDEQVSIEPPT
jgi:lipoprotein LprG